MPHMQKPQRPPKPGQGEKAPSIEIHAFKRVRAVGGGGKGAIVVQAGICRSSRLAFLYDHQVGPGCLAASLPACLAACLPAWLPACLPACVATLRTDASDKGLSLVLTDVHIIKVPAVQLRVLHA